ncbi:MFS transporter [Brevibacillus centrosporus]|uniref:MFS transporter n=1 Tax=Brevibacillus centrosporus TaxID=54910 RepID=UPI002E1F23F7|nr:MFS transporter [Brevibacillus centrosporus]
MGRARVTHHPYVYLFVCFTFLLTLADATFILFLPLYLSSVLKMEPIHIGVLSGIVPLAATLGGFLAGSLSDVLGRKPVLILSMFAYSVFMIGFALSKEPVLLFLFVFLKGFFSGFFSPVSKALMADVTPSEYHLKVFSLRYLVVNIAYALGPLIGLLADIEGSIESFYVAAAV